MKTITTFICLVSFITNIYSQVSPPGLGDANTASWFALGLRQDINAKQTIESMTYIGIGAKKIEHQKMYLNKPAIWVINQEFFHEMNKNIDLSYAASYRRQMEYEYNSYNNPITSSVQQEFRIYGRFAYAFKLGNIKFKQTARQEFRRFTDQNFNNTDEPLQLRSRLKSQVSFYLDTQKQHKLTADAEALFSNSKNQDNKDWSGLKYKEARFTLFYTYTPKETPLAISIGYMNNLIDKNSTHSVHYTSVDMVWENPFKIFENKKPNQLD